LKCHGAGIVHPRLTDGSVDFSRVILCRYCATPEQIAKALGISSVGATFDNFRPIKGSTEALSAAKLIATLETNWKMLLIYGTNGNGKTHLLESISLTLWDKGILCRVRSMVEIVHQLKATFDIRDKDETNSYQTMMENFCKTPYLIIDDLGSADSNTDWCWSQIEAIMLSRYRDNLFTVMTTNKDIAKMPGFIISRFKDARKSRMVLNSAPDQRPQQGVSK